MEMLKCYCSVLELQIVVHIIHKYPVSPLSVQLTVTVQQKQTVYAGL